MMPNFNHSVKAVVRELYDDNSPPKYIVEYNGQIPAVGKNSVLIQVKACAISEIDDKVSESCCLFRSIILPSIDPLSLDLSKGQDVLRNLLKDTSRTRYPVGQDIAGIVQQVGCDVETLRKGDAVVGIVPLDYNMSGCADFVVLGEFDVVKKPARISFVNAAGCVGDALKAYTALHYLGRLCSGQTVLVVDGASSFGSLVVQFALHWGAKVMSTASTDDEKLYLEGIEPELVCVIDTGKGGSSLKKTCLEETGGMGVDIIIDNGAMMMFKKEDFKNDNNHVIRQGSISKQDIINSLAVGGRWITSSPNLQLDPPNSRLLYMKCASLCFLFEHAWTLSSAQQGAYQHILMDIMEKVAEGTIRPNIHHTVSFEAIPDAIRCLPEIRVGKVISTL